MSQSQSQSQSRPLHHQLLFSGTRVGANDSTSTSNSTTQAHGATVTAAFKEFKELGKSGRGDEQCMKRRKKAQKLKPCPLGLSEVPMNLPPIPSDRPGSASRFKGVTKNRKKWQARIKIPSEGGEVHLGTFDSEEEAGIMYARARYNYPLA